MSVRYDPETDYIQIYNGFQWIDWMAAGLLFDGIFFSSDKGYNTPYLSGFDKISQSTGEHIASVSSTLNFASDGSLMFSASLTNKNENYQPGTGSTALWMSKETINLKNYANLKITGYFNEYMNNSLDDNSSHGNLSIIIYAKDKTTILTSVQMDRGTKTTKTINVSSINDEEVYIGVNLSAYSWGVSVVGTNKSYIYSIIAE